MKFSYTALSSDNQKLTGVLEASNQDAAQEELHKMGVSIISITEITDAQYDEINKKGIAQKEKTGVLTYTFLAIDKGGKEINGTIDARNPYSAYKRLITEYGFKINKLYVSTATDSERANSIKKITEYEAKIKDEGFDVDVNKSAADNELLEVSEKLDQKIIDEIDQFIINTKKVLTEHKNKFSPPFLKQIESTLGELERVRTSNNIKHITETCNEIYELISNPDKLVESAEGQENVSYRQIVDSLEGTGMVKKQFNIHSKAVGLSKIKSIFGKVFKKLKLTGESKSSIPGGPQKEESGIKKFFSSIADKFGSKKKVPTFKEAPKASKPKSIIGLFFSYLSAPNAMLRKARKQELKSAFSNWKESKKKVKGEKEIVKDEMKTKEPETTQQDKITEETIEKMEDDENAMPAYPKWRASAIFSEVDSFIGWLLFFYILYFFLVDFSFEKDIGIPREFVIKTIKTPLILDITILLLVVHLLFKLRGSYFRNNAVGSVFLFLFGLGFYSLIILNF